MVPYSNSNCRTTSCNNNNNGTSNLNLTIKMIRKRLLITLLLFTTFNFMLVTYLNYLHPLASSTFTSIHHQMMQQQQGKRQLLERIRHRVLHPLTSPPITSSSRTLSSSTTATTATATISSPTLSLPPAPVLCHDNQTLELGIYGLQKLSIQVYPHIFNRERNVQSCNVPLYTKQSVEECSSQQSDHQNTYNNFNRDDIEYHDDDNDDFSVLFATQTTLDRLFRIQSLIRHEIPTLALRSSGSSGSGSGSGSGHRRRRSLRDIHLSIVIDTENVNVDWHVLHRSVWNSEQVCQASSEIREWCTRNLAIHLVRRDLDAPYPINYMRNLSMRLSSRPCVVGNNAKQQCGCNQWIMLYDIDFMIGPHVIADLSSAIRRYPHRTKSGDVVVTGEEEHGDDAVTSNMFIAPAFEYFFPAQSSVRTLRAHGIEPEPSYGVPVNKAELIKGMNSKIIDKFHLSERGHGPTNYGKWKRSNEPYPLTFSSHNWYYEPYVFFHRSKLFEHYPNGSLCDERFYGRGFNKIQCYDEMVYRMDLKPIVLPNSYLIHFDEKKDKKLGLRFKKMVGAYELYSQILSNLQKLKS